MKPEFLIIIAFTLITGFCLTRLLHDGSLPAGPPKRTMTSSNDHDYEQIVQTGKLTFNNDTTAIASLTPGSYFRYTHNNRKVIAEASMKGDISYSFYTDGDKTGFDPQFLSAAIKITIARKFDK
jgi:hypothetical protein